MTSLLPLLACRDPVQPLLEVPEGILDTQQPAIPDPDGSDPPTHCKTIELQAGQAGRIETRDAAVDIPQGAFTDLARVALCKVDAPGGWRALSDGWTIQVDPELTPTRPLQLAIRTADSTPAAALFVPGPADTAVRSLVATWDETGGYQSPIWRLGVSFVAEDTRTVIAYEPGPSALDLLLVLDDTATMLDEQLKLEGLLPDLLDALDVYEVDWHVGVVTTDPNEAGVLFNGTGGPLWIDPATPRRLDAIHNLVNVGNDGPQTEEGITAARAALITDPTSGFLRPDAALAVLVVSSVDDHSSVDVPTFAGELADLERPLAGFHSLVQLAGDDRGSRYLELSGLTGGHTTEIYGGDWTAWLDRIGDGVIRYGGMEISLDEPIPELWVIPPGNEPGLCPDTAVDEVYSTISCLTTLPDGAELWLVGQ